VARIAADLGDAPATGTLERALAAAVHDPGLRIVYELDDGRVVDARGERASARGGEATTTLTRDGRAVAVLLHRRAAADTVGQLGSGIRLALDNERLRAALLAEAREIRSSRERIVVAGDAARRRLERDLHDGAQQRLIALSYHLRVAGSVAAEEGEHAAAARLASALDSCLAALAELRTVAHGIHPAVLVDAGLGAALEDLADISPVPVTTTVLARDRLPGRVEAAAYAIVRLVVDAASEAGAEEVDVRVVREDDRLVIELQVDLGGAPPPIGVLDRAGALGGTVRIRTGGLRVELPCA
jgi:signal transduction histidine kinase